METEYITLLGDVKIPGPNKHFQRISNEYILYIIRSGHMKLVENDIMYQLYPGDMILLEPSLLHYGIRSKSSIEYSFLHISMGINTANTEDDKNAPVLEQFSQIKKVSFPMELFQNIIQLFEELKKTYHSTSLYRSTKIRSLFYLFLIQILEFQNGSTSVSAVFNQEQKRSVQKISTRDLSDFLRQNCQRTIRSHDLESIFHHNFDYMNRIFKADFGMTIFQYLEDYRISEAKKMLQTHAFSISQIAESLGFCNTYYFSRVFKKKTGISPSNWNKEETYLP